jgi:hypothetical protein
MLHPDKLIEIIQQVYSATNLDEFIQITSEFHAIILIIFLLKWTHNREFNATIHVSFSQKYELPFVENSGTFRLNCCHIANQSSAVTFLSLFCVKFLSIVYCHFSVTCLLTRFCD